jgi:hypothetical protein
VLPLGVGDDRFWPILLQKSFSDSAVLMRPSAGRVMMGRSSQDQGQLFYSFNLEEVVPDDHQVRAIARVLDLSWVRAELALHYSHTGRPSI